MKTAFNTTAKDNVATAIVLIGLFIGSIAAVANSATVNTNGAMNIETMDAIVVTAERMPVEKMDAIIVTASRHAAVLATAK